MRGYVGTERQTTPRLGMLSLDAIPEFVEQLFLEEPPLRWRWEGYSMSTPLLSPDEIDTLLAADLVERGATPEETAAALIHRHRNARDRQRARIERCCRIAAAAWAEARRAA